MASARAWVLLVSALPLVLDAAVARTRSSAPVLDLIDETAKPTQELDLLEKAVFQKKKENKKWNWKEASEESKTEWAIVLKRYVMVDMTLFELARHFGQALPGKSQDGTPEASEEDRHDALGMAEKKMARLEANLARAVLDQNTSDATAADMQKARKTNLLTVHEKRILAEEHKREAQGFFAVEASGQDVLEKSKELLQALQQSDAAPKKPQPSWSSIVAAPVTPKPTYMSMLNMTQVAAPKKANTTSLRGAPSNTTESSSTIQVLFQKFHDAAKTFHGDLGNFESMQTKAVTNLLSLSS